MKFYAGIVFMVLGLAILLKLGFWQLGRLPEKNAEIAKIDAFIGAAPIALPAHVTPEQDEYRPVMATGTISTRDYGAGFRIIAPFETTDGRKIMIDRGYVHVEDKETARALGEVEITGNLHWPDEGGYWIPDDAPDDNYWYQRDVPTLAAALGTEEVLIVASNTNDPHILPLPVDSAHIPNNHLSYAIQWFLFAAIWLGMTSALLWRIRRPKRVRAERR